jgi:hypothetical protein
MAENQNDLPLVKFEYLCKDLNNYTYFYEIGDKPIRKLELEGGE